MLNLQGDIEKIYDATGEVVVTYIYDAWGKLISIEDDTTNNIGTKNPLRYRGYYYDTETGFYYLQSRYYDPEICRFINADSLLIAGDDYIQGTNRYAYCYNNPVMYSDPTGYMTTQELVSDSIAIVACLIYIDDYAKKYNKDVYAVYDFLGRTINDKSTLSDIANALRIGVKILEGDHVWLYSGVNGSFLDMLEITGKYIPGIIGESASALQLYTKLMADRYNPLMYDEEVTKNMLIHVVAIAGGIGIAKISSEFAVAITAATGGNVVIGTAAGFVAYFGLSYLWDEFSYS